MNLKIIFKGGIAGTMELIKALTHI